MVQDLLLEIATTINEVCSKPAVSTQYGEEPQFLEDDSEQIVVDFDDDGSLVIDSNTDGDTAPEIDNEIQDPTTEEVAYDIGDDEPLVVGDNAAEMPPAGDEVTHVDDSALADDSDTFEDIDLAEDAAAEEPAAEELVAEELASEEPAAEELAAEEPAAEELAAEELAAEEPAAEELAAEEPAAEDLAGEEPAAEESAAEELAAEEAADEEESVADESVAEEAVAEEPAADTLAAEGERTGIDDVSEDPSYEDAPSQQIGNDIPYFATAAPMAESTYVPVAVPQPAALSPTPTTAAEGRSPAEIFNAVAAASITSVPIFVPVQTVMADSDNTMTVTFPRFQGYSQADVTVTTTRAVAATVVPMALDINSTVEDSANASTNSGESGLYNSSSPAIYNQVYNSSGSAIYQAESGYIDNSRNFSSNTTDPIYDSSSHNIGVTATIVIGAAIGVAFALF
ncbi:hypothetical protein V1509DRAFT_378020 [Lipomyces kononenkoae]